MQTIFTDTPREESSPIGKCLEVFQGLAVQSKKREEIS